MTSTRVQQVSEANLAAQSSLSGVGGIGSGTVLIAVATYLGLGSAAGAILISVTPAATVVAREVCHRAVLRRELRRHRRQIGDLSEALRAALDDPKLSEQLKTQLRVHLDEVVEFDILRRIQQAFSIIPASSPQQGIGGARNSLHQ